MSLGVAQMAKTKSTKLVVKDRGAIFEFGIHKPTGQYRKKYRGRTLYLGADPDSVLDQWLEKTDRIKAEADGGGKPPGNDVETSEVTVSQLCGLFIESKEGKVATGELEQATLRNYRAYCKRIINFFGRSKRISDLTPQDFERLRADYAKPKAQYRNGKKIKYAKSSLSLSGLKSKIIHTRVIFKYAVDCELLDKVPWGKSFDVPSPKAIKKQRQAKPRKQATLDEIRTILAEANETWTALIYFAINTGSPNMDCGHLRFSDIDANGWVEKPRHKTGEPRRYKLWPETVAAINKLPRFDDGLVFHGPLGGNYIPKGRTNQVSKIFTELAVEAGVKRQNLTFYSLRHTFQNIADEKLDFPAVKRVMGHQGQKDISDNYRGEVSDERIERVCEHVRRWFFGECNA